MGICNNCGMEIVTSDPIVGPMCPCGCAIVDSRHKYRDIDREGDDWLGILASMRVEHFEVAS